MRKYFLTSLVSAILLLITAGATAQVTTPTPPDDPNAQITFPPVVSVLSGTVEIEGTANIDDQSGYFLQYRELDDNLEPVGGQDALYSPVSVQVRERIVDDLLAQWDTTTVDDGIYEVQLVVNRSSGDPVRDTLAAVRVANETEVPGLATATIASQIVLATPTRTLTPEPTTPTLSAAVEANVRSGDSTLYPVVGFLLQGEEAPIIGRSSQSGWYYIRLSDGDEGFISDSIVQVSGDVSNLRRVVPPPVPFTPTPTSTPTPIATNTPVTSANLVIDSFRLEPSNPVCGQTFTIVMVIENTGTTDTNNSATIDVDNRHLDSGSVTEETVGAVPVISADGQFTARIPITVDTFEGETQRLEIRLDSTNNVPETNEGDNFFTFDYTLQTSDSCG